MKRTGLLLILAIIFQLNLHAQIHGDYTIDITKPTGGNNFQSFHQLYWALRYDGIDGDLTINIASGHYTQNLQLIYIKCLVNNPKIIVQSLARNADSVIISGNEHASFEAPCHFIVRDITFISNSSFNPALMYGEATKMELENNKFFSEKNTYLVGGLAQKSFIKNNHFYGAQSHLYVDPIWSEDVIDSLIIENNHFENIDGYGLSIGSDDVICNYGLVKGNVFLYNSVSTNSYNEALIINMDSTNSFQISNNYFGSNVEIDFNYSDEFIITSNTIDFETDRDDEKILEIKGKNISIFNNTFKGYYNCTIAEYETSGIELKQGITNFNNNSIFIESTDNCGGVLIKLNESINIKNNVLRIIKIGNTLTHRMVNDFNYCGFDLSYDNSFSGDTVRIDSNIIEMNATKGNLYGISVNPYSSINNSGSMEIESNQLLLKSLGSVSGISFEYGSASNFNTSLNIADNKISVNSAFRYNGIYLHNRFPILNIERNKVYINSNLEESDEINYGIHLRNYYSECNNIIAYNMVNINSNSEVGAINLYNSDTAYIFNNTFRIEGDSCVNSYIMKYSNDILLKSNIFINNRVGSLIYNSPFPCASDYNCFYTKSDASFIRGEDEYNLISWQQISNLDSNSFEYLPVFFSDFDLHTSDDSLQNRGFLNEFSFDIDGDSIQGIPDVGADEFSINNYDIGVSSFLIEKSTRDSLFFTVTNFGLNNVDSIKVKGIVNNQIYEQNYSNLNLNYKDKIDLSLEVNEIAYDTTSMISLCTHMPNGYIDENRSNDTININDFKPRLPGGIYQIGELAPYFKTITSACNYICNYGIEGPIVFEIETGVYDEQLSLWEIPGSDSANVVKFQSKQIDSSTVEIVPVFSSYSNYYRNKHAIHLNNTSNITFSHITIGTNFRGDELVCFDRNCSNITIENSVLKNKTGLLNKIYSYRNYLLKEITIRNNLFDSIECINSFSTSTHSSKTKIDGFYIKNNDIYGRISQNYGDLENFVIENNYLDHINLYDFINVNISNNRIRSKNFEAISLSNPELRETELLIANNEIISQNNGSIELYKIKDANIYHNSIASNGNALILSRCYGTESRNNIFFCRKHYPIIDIYPYSIIDSAFSISDNNVYFNLDSSNIFKAYYNFGMQEWQQLTLQDSNSLFIDPKYCSDTMLETKISRINNIGDYLLSVPIDINGNDRNIENPDPGAYEYDPVHVSVGVTKLRTNLPCSDTLEITLQNYGSDTIFFSEIYCKIDSFSAKKIGEFSGVLPPVRDTALKVIDTTLKHAHNYQFKLWSAMPNHIIDEYPVDDTLTVEQVSRMEGDYFVGTNGRFPTIQQAIDTLEFFGMCGAVNLLIEPGTYDEEITIPKILGNSHENYLTLQSTVEDSVSTVITRSNNGSIITIDGCEYLKIKYLKVWGQENQLNNLISITDNTIKYIEMDNCCFYSDVNYIPHPGQAPPLIYKSYSNVKDTISINNCFFRGGQHSIKNSSPSYNNEQTIFIKNNIFENFYELAISLSNLNDAVLSGNSFQNSYFETYGNAVNIAAIYISSCDSVVEISSNSMVLNAMFHTINAIYLSKSWDEGGEYIVKNNMIRINCSDTLDIFEVHGINSAYDQKINIYNNTISIGNDYNQILGNSAAIKMHPNIEEINVINNVFVNHIGYSYNFQYGYYGLESNNNIFYSPNDYHAIVENTGVTIGSLADWQSMSNNDMNSYNHLPMFMADEDLHINDPIADSNAISIDVVNDDFDGEIRDSQFPDIGADEFDLIPYPTIEIDFNVKNSVCEGDSISVNANLTGTPPWKIVLADTITYNEIVYDSIFESSSNIYLTPEISTTWFVRSVHDAFCPFPGCDVGEKLPLQIVYPVQLNTCCDTTICENDSIQLHAQHDGDYIFWEPTEFLNSNTSNNPLAFPQETTTFYAYTSNICGTFIDSIQVIVNPSPMVFLGNDTLISDTSTIILDAGEGFDSYLWFDGSFEQTLIVDSTFGLGEHLIWIMVTDSNFCSNSDSIFVEIINNIGYDKLSIFPQIKIFPNPTSGKITIEKDNETNYIVRILNNQGIEVHENKLNNKQLKIDLSAKPAGVYLIQFIENNEKFEQKIIIQ